MYKIEKNLQRKKEKGKKQIECVTNSSETDIYTPSSVTKLLQQRLHLKCVEWNYFMLEYVS